MLKINNVLMPTPKKYEVGVMDLSHAERLANGDLVLEIVTTKVKIELEWTVLEPEQLSTLLLAVKPTFFEVEYYDAENNSMATGTFYKGDRRLPIVLVKNGVPIWDGTAFNLIER